MSKWKDSFLLKIKKLDETKKNDVLHEAESKMKHIQEELSKAEELEKKFTIDGDISKALEQTKVIEDRKKELEIVNSYIQKLTDEYVSPITKEIHSGLVSEVREHYTKTISDLYEELWKKVLECEKVVDSILEMIAEEDSLQDEIKDLTEGAFGTVGMISRIDPEIEKVFKNDSFMSIKSRIRNNIQEDESIKKDEDESSTKDEGEQ